MLREQRRLKTRIKEYFDQNISAAVIDFKLEARAHFSNRILIRAFVYFYTDSKSNVDELASNYRERKIFKPFS